MPRTAKQVLQEIGFYCDKIKHERDPHVKQTYTNNLVNLRHAVKQLDSAQKTVFHKFFNTYIAQKYGDQYDRLMRIWAQYEKASEEARLHRQGNNQTIEGVNTASSPAAIGQHILSPQQLRQLEDALSQEPMASQSPFTGYGPGTQQDPTMGSYGYPGSMSGQVSSAKNSYGHGNPQGYTMGQDNQYTDQGYQPQGLPLVQPRAVSKWSSASRRWSK